MSEILYEVTIRFVNKAQAEEYRDKISKRFGLYVEKLREVEVIKPESANPSKPKSHEGCYQYPEDRKVF